MAASDWPVKVAAYEHGKSGSWSRIDVGLRKDVACGVCVAMRSAVMHGCNQED